MQRTVAINFKGQESSFKVSRIERSKLYGSRRRIPVDASGRPCSRAYLTADGRYILPPGSTSRLYLDESGNVVEREHLQAIAANGKVVAKYDGSGIIETGEAAQAIELLDYGLTHAYALEPVFLAPELCEALSQGHVYHLPGFYDNSDGGRQAFLLGNDNGYFVLLGCPTGFKFIGLPEADLSPPDMDDEYLEKIDLSDDLDFAMY